MKNIVVWLLLLLCMQLRAQVLTVRDSAHGTAISGAVLTSIDPQASATTDTNGQADITAFKGAQEIRIEAGGYKIISSYAALERQNFVLLFSRQLTLDEVIVSAYTDDVSRETAIHIEALQAREIERQGSFNLTDALSQLPGISQLSTGIAISKPVIRGLYGNRILVVFSGLRFDNQQWQDEHGLGISDIGISKAEIIKGPLSLLYGTEAVGGVINILEERIPAVHTLETDAALEFHSNTLGGMLQAGVKANFGKRWFRLRAGFENHADYSDGNNDRVLNSRFNGYYLKSTFGFERKKWQSENYYHFSYNNFSFVFNDLIHFFDVDARWSRAMQGPHHIVILHLLSSVNTIQLRKSTLKLNAGLQSNYRSEDEGRGELSLQMHLTTLQYGLKWSSAATRKTQVVLAHNVSAENNTNYGRRKIIPDAWMAEAALSAFVKHRIGRQLIVEYGAGTGLRYIKTLLTAGVNSAEKEIMPFSQTRLFANGMLGASYHPFRGFNVKVNGATGVRAPNLAELSSNGLHEGIYVYEVGDPGMKNEQNLNVDLTVDYAQQWAQLSLSGFYNRFFGYIYLEPTAEEWFGFPVARFVQRNAALYGAEGSVSITPVFAKGLKLSASYALVIGKLDHGDYLPYMPAQKLKPGIRYDYQGGKVVRSAYGFVNTEVVLQQRRVNPAEAFTPSYVLLNAGAGLTFGKGGITYDVSIAANNLLNEAYYDHLSRFKTFGLLNMGRDISIHFKINFLKQLKKQSK